ncbi:MAG: GlsB/YeaQ/YmgE family stress response membrane protein [Bacteroidota bacterium]
MLGYLISLITGAVIGFIATKLFRGAGWGIVENIICGAIGGMIGNYFLGDFFHSFENFVLENSLPAFFGASGMLLIVMFAFNHDSD